MISCCVLLASAAFLMQFIKESQVRVRQARFKTGFPENTTIFCNFSLVFLEQDKLACVHLAVTLTRFAVFPSILSPTRHHPSKYLLAYCKTNWIMNQVMQLNHTIMPSVSDQGKCVTCRTHTTVSHLCPEPS